MQIFEIIIKVIDYSLLPDSLIISHLNESIATGDTYLSQVKDVAIEYISNILGYNYLQTSITATITKESDDEYFYVDYEKFFTITSLTGSTSYIVDSEHNNIKIQTSEIINTISVNYSCGYNNYIPKPLIHATLIKIADLWDIERNSMNLNNMVHNDVIDKLLKQYKKSFLI